jgi:hypothetical protein
MPGKLVMHQSGTAALRRKPPGWGRVTADVVAQHSSVTRLESLQGPCAATRPLHVLQEGCIMASSCPTRIDSCLRASAPKEGCVMTPDQARVLICAKTSLYQVTVGIR